MRSPTRVDQPTASAAEDTAAIKVDSNSNYDDYMQRPLQAKAHSAKHEVDAFATVSIAVFDDCCWLQYSHIWGALGITCVEASLLLERS